MIGFSTRGSLRGQARWPRLILRAAAALALALGFSITTRAQSIEPRLFSNAPIGLNFLIVGYTRSSGGVVLDASIPVEDAHMTANAPILGYARSLDISGMSGQIQFLVPYAWFSGQGLLATTGQVATRDVNGFGDPGARFTWNVHGAPALTAAEFGGYRQDLVVGVSLQVTAPYGQYDSSRLINLGTNRWSFKPEFGLSKALGRWILEGTGAVNVYTDNNDYFGGKHLSQDPLYSVQGHVVYRFPRGDWVSLDATYYTGGRTTIDGVEGNDLQSNSRYGLTGALPVNRQNSIKLYASNGLTTRVGQKFLLTGVAWNYRWSGGK